MFWLLIHLMLHFLHFLKLFFLPFFSRKEGVARIWLNSSRVEQKITSRNIKPVINDQIQKRIKKISSRHWLVTLDWLSWIGFYELVTLDWLVILNWLSWICDHGWYRTPLASSRTVSHTIAGFSFVDISNSNSHLHLPSWNSCKIKSNLSLFTFM